MNRVAAYLLLLFAVAICGCTNARTPAETAEEQPAPLRRARLLFAGDVMCHMPQVNAARAAANGGYDFTPTFRYVKPLFDSADVTIVNFETTVSPDGRYSGYPCFSSPVELASALRDAGADIAVTANNHCCDRLAGGIRSTAACLDSLGFARTGAFADSTDYARNRILRFRAGDMDFTLLNYTYGTNGIPVPSGCIVNHIDTVRMAADLKECADADCRIVYLHWGVEYERVTNAEQRRIRDFLQRQGVEIVIGSHPHVIQPAEVVDNKVFVSSLGNFVSNQRKRFCDGGLIAVVTVDEQPEGGFVYGLELTPVWVRLPRYEILPPQVADTLSLSAAERTQYRQFIGDTEQLLFKGK